MWFLTLTLVLYPNLPLLNSDLLFYVNNLVQIYDLPLVRTQTLFLLLIFGIGLSPIHFLLYVYEAPEITSSRILGFFKFLAIFLLISITIGVVYLLIIVIRIEKPHIAVYVEKYFPIFIIIVGTIAILSLIREKVQAHLEWTKIQKDLASNNFREKVQIYQCFEKIKYANNKLKFLDFLEQHLKSPPEGEWPDRKLFQARNNEPGILLAKLEVKWLGLDKS